MATKVPAKGQAGIYVRISRDRATEVSTEVQEKECRDLCDKRGWDVVEVYTDAGRSAFKRDTPRPAFDRLLADVEAGRVDRVVAFKVDRLARNVADFIGFVDRAENVGATVSLSSQDFDTSTASGRLLRTILASFAEFESELKRERIGGSMAHKAEAGKAHPAGTRLFGYTASRDEIVTDEAREIRKAAKRLLGGWSLAEIARDLNERNITTTKGRTWRPWVLGRLLRNPFLAGHRDYKGQRIVGDWPAILDEEMHSAVVALLDDPDRTTATGTAPRHLLAGIVYCGECGARMVSRPLRPGVDRYVCQEAERGGCGKIMVNATLADERVHQHVLGLLAENADSIAAALGTVDVAALEREAAEISARQTQLAEEWARGDLDRAEWRAARDVLAERAEQIDRDRNAVGRRTPALPRDRGGLETLWDAATAEERRELVRLVVDRVEIGPGERGRWNPERVTILP
jgi:site-specific DNA recombinase